MIRVVQTNAKEGPRNHWDNKLRFRERMARRRECPAPEDIASDLDDPVSFDGAVRDPISHLKTTPDHVEPRSNASIWPA